MSQNIFVFDAYGTLFDVHAAVRRHMEKVGSDGAELSAIWRSKQLEYSWTRALMGQYRDFWSLTEESLDYAFSAVPGANRASRDDLLSAYKTLDTYVEVPGVLKQLSERGAKLAILSNGSPDMLHSAVRSAGLDSLLDAVFSVDDLKTFKTDPKIYEMVTVHYRVYPSAITFQSSNRWDIAGAKAFGFNANWINRAGAIDEYRDLAPDAVLPDLNGVLSL